MTWFTKKPQATQESYFQSGAALVGHLFNRLGVGQGQTYTDEESMAIGFFRNDFVAWGKQQSPPLIAVNPDGQIFYTPEFPPNSFQGYTTSTALQKLYRSDAYKHKGAQERLTTALREWISCMDTGVLRDMIPMLRELGWEDEVDRVSRILQQFPPRVHRSTFNCHHPPPSPRRWFACIRTGAGFSTRRWTQWAQCHVHEGTRAMTR